MAKLKIRDHNLTVTDAGEIASRLESIGIRYERWQASRPLADDATAEAVLEAYKDDIETLNQRGGYVTADVIDLQPTTPGLDQMLAKFDREHWHDEDEVRFVVAGSGTFFIRPEGEAVHEVEVTAGDLLSVPRAIRHWFHLCDERRIRAIRLFQDPSGWTPHYTDSDIASGYQPMCMSDWPGAQPASS